MTEKDERPFLSILSESTPEGKILHSYKHAHGWKIVGLYDDIRDLYLNHAMEFKKFQPHVISKELSIRVESPKDGSTWDVYLENPDRIWKGFATQDEAREAIRKTFGTEPREPHT